MMALSIVAACPIPSSLPFLSPIHHRAQPQKIFPLSGMKAIVRRKSKGFALCSIEESSSQQRGKEGGNLLQTAGSIGAMTAFSKGLGLLRETLLAAVFGVGPMITAFNYSSVLPGFFMAIFGGINGPLQITTMSFLSKYGRKRGQVLVGKISTFIALVTGAITLVLAIFPCNIIDAVAPGLLKEYSQNGSITRNLAIIQLRIMAPCTLMAGLIGVGFGSLSAAGVYEVLALSPSLSSLSIIVVVIMYIAFLGIHNHSLGNPITGAISLALGVLIGAFCQLLWQVRAHYALGFPFLQFHPVNPFTDKDIYEIAMVLFPAILGSSMLQFATLTDLYFASFIPEAAAGLGYANLLVMAPLGILSSSIILPMISLFAEFIEPPDFAALKDRLSEAILLVLVTSLSMTAIVLPLSRPLVEVVLQRLSFGVSASTMVSSILSYYIAGSSIYLMREVFIQLFYILGDGKTPFCISIAAIAVNALLDWALVRAFSFGPEGLVLATTLVHTLSIVALIAILYRKLDGLPLRKWLYFCGLIFGASILAGGATKTSYKWGFGVLLKLRLLWVKIFSMLFASCIGLTTFCLVICIFGQTEIQILKRVFYRRLKNQI